MIGVLALAAVSHHNLLAGLSRLRAKTLDLLDDIHPLHHLAEHHVLPIQPLSLGGADKELGSVGVGPSIGHGENSWECQHYYRNDRQHNSSPGPVCFRLKFSSSNLLP